MCVWCDLCGLRFDTAAYSGIKSAPVGGYGCSVNVRREGEGLNLPPPFRAEEGYFGAVRCLKKRKKKKKKKKVKKKKK